MQENRGKNRMLNYLKVVAEAYEIEYNIFLRAYIASPTKDLTDVLKRCKEIDNK